MDLNNIWNTFLEKMQKDLDPVIFDIWFKNTKLISLKDDTATVQVEYAIHKKQMINQWNNTVENVFSEITGTNFKFEYVTQDEINNNITIDTNKLGVPTNAFFESNLDSKYTFDNFVAGNSNKFAKTIALSVAERPGLMYNPLYIYGNSGLGKTHLMHSRVNYIRQNSNKKVLYVTSDDFMTDFTGLSRKSQTDNNLS